MSKTEKAIFAAGCFWGVQYYFDQVPGVIKTTAGYIGGHADNPTYEQVCTHTTGHAEAVEIIFDPGIVPFKTLLMHLFRIHDPTQLNRQGPDIGDNYRSAIFYTTPRQKLESEQVIQDLTNKNTYDKPIVTEVSKASQFFPAEEYHQKYAERTGHGMCHVDYAPVK